MKLLLTALLFIIVQSSFAQIKVMKLDSAHVPKFAKYKGYLDTAVRYTDKEGDHILITSENFDDNFDKDSSEFRSADLYAYNYLVNGNAAKLEWQIHDLVEPCGEDVEAAFLPHTLAITDMNKNGIAEVWLMYKIACSGDVSPRTQKIIMHEGVIKYAVRGTNKVKVSATEYFGGSYTFDPAFNSLPDVFKNYARQLWKKNLMEVWPGQ
jgi:hypothetical protein